MRSSLSRYMAVSVAVTAVLALWIILCIFRVESSLFSRDSHAGTPLSKETCSSPWSGHFPSNTLRPGELPGYTGWARPTTTLAGSFAIRDYEISATVGQNWTVTVQCDHKACPQGGSLFYVRAYGPAVLTGIVQDHGDGSYSATFQPFDPGTYTVEMALTFSQPPDLSTFPRHDEPSYEGHLLPGFPLLLSASGSLLSSPIKPCQTDQLDEASTTSALSTGRWVVTHKSPEEPYREDLSSETITFGDYNWGSQSLGVLMEYRPLECALIAPSIAQSEKTLETCRAQSSSSKTPHVILIGDSNFRLQAEMLEKTFFGRTLKVTFLKTNEGIAIRLPGIRQKLADLAQLTDEYDFFIMFNGGLHDIISLCTYDYPYWPQTDHATAAAKKNSSRSCLDEYRKHVIDFAALVDAFPAQLIVWQTTTAGWMKYGVYAISWPAVKQKLPLEPSMVARLNEIAWEVLQKYERIRIIDAYWLTLARPDHRDSREKNAVGKRLVHAGPQVYDVLLRKFAVMMLEVMCPVWFENE